MKTKSIAKIYQDIRFLDLACRTVQKPLKFLVLDFHEDRDAKKNRRKP